jgi:antirestriction protein ArdC
MDMKKKRDIYQEVTDKMLETMESGNIPWLKPWTDTDHGDAAMPYNAISGKNYQGVNTLLLWCSGYSSQSWLTFKQAKSLGGSVRKGERGRMITYFSPLKITETVNGEDIVKTIPLLKNYVVFNVEQCDGLDHSKIKAPEPIETNFTTALQFALDAGATVNHGGNKAFYAPGQDAITMPPQRAFNDLYRYESTLLHELTHWTGHKTRCDRLKGSAFGSSSYAFEELVAEIGSAMLCALLGVRADYLQHASYLQSWIKVLKEDKKAIFKAAKLATQASDYALQASGLQVEAA